MQSINNQKIYNKLYVNQKNTDNVSYYKQLRKESFETILENQENLSSEKVLKKRKVQT